MPYRKASNWFALSAVSISLLANVGVYVSRSAVIHENCVQVQKINGYLSGAIERSRATLPTLAYYKAHPAELQAALGEINREASDFMTANCDKQFLPW